MTRTAEVPGSLFDAAPARRCLERIVGASDQVPPAFSAIKVEGRVSHRAARSGETLALMPRPVEVYSARLLDIDSAAATWRVALHVSKGTYVRALARDLGRSCGTAAHLARLRRTASGELGLAEAHTLDDVLDAAARGSIDTLFADPVAVLGLPVVTAERRAIADGAPLPCPKDVAEADRVAVVADGALAGIYRPEDGLLVAETVFPPGAAS